MRLSLFAALAVAALTPAWAVVPTAPPTQTSPPPPTPLPPGAWVKTPLTPDLSSLLYSSLANVTSYKSGINVRMCVKDISLLESAQVAGMNYRFTTTACDVPRTLQLQFNQQNPTSAAIGKYLGQCTADFARNCATLDAVVTIWKKLDASREVSSIIARVTDGVKHTGSSDGPDGGYGNALLTPELTSLLYTSLANVGLYGTGVNARVCVSTIMRVEGQSMAGTNYRFTSRGCDVRETLRRQSNQQQGSSAIAKYLGQCKSSFASNCVGVDIVAIVYRKYDGSVKVTSIDTKVLPTRVHAAQV